MEQVPEFAKVLSEILGDFNDTIQYGLKSNDEHLKAYYSIATANIEALQKELDKPSLSVDERSNLIDKMLDIQNQVAVMVTKNQHFIHREHLIVGTIIFFIIGSVATILGANINSQVANPKL